MKKNARGVTLLELMTALTVLGVLVAISAPAFRQFTADSRTTAAINDLVSALNLARSEALRRSAPAVTCSSDDQETCAGDDDWATGWIVFADVNANGDADAGELIQAWPAVGGNMTLDGSAARVTYNTMGMREPMTGGNITFDVHVSGCSGRRAGVTRVLPVGTIQSSKVDCP